MTERGSDRFRALLGGLRVRIVVVFFVLLATAALVGSLVIRGVLLARLDERVAAELSQEGEELDRFVSNGVDPADGEPFGSDITQLFSVFLQRNVPTATRRSSPMYRHRGRSSVTSASHGSPSTTTPRSATASPRWSRDGASASR